MLRFKLPLLGLIAVFAVSVTGATSASAHRYIGAPCEEVSVESASQWSTKALCEAEPQKAPDKGKWRHKELANGTKVTGTSGVSKLATEISKKAITIVCNNDKFEGELEKEGKSKATITYENCSLEGLAGCTVPNIEARVLDALVENAGKVEDKFSQVNSETPFAKVVIQVCALKKTYNVTGEQTCELPKGTELLVVHEIACKTSGSNLKFETAPATYEGTAKVELVSKEKWAAE
jgi:hypothetical protein